MSKEIKYIYLLIIPWLSFSACEDHSGLGDDFIIKETVDLYYRDFPMTLSTVMFDSLPTSGTESLLVGYHEDEELGDITAKAYFEIGLPTSELPERGDYFEKLYLRLYHTGYSYYDTSQTLAISVHQLTEELEYHDTGALYNTSRFEYATTSIGQLSLSPKPTKNEYIDIPLEESFANEIFQLAISDDEIFSNENNFKEKYKGFVLVSEQNGPIVAFSGSSTLVLQFRRNEEELTTTFPIGTSEIHFNQITSDRSNTNLADLITQKDPLSSSLTANQVFLHGGIGLAVRFELSNLDELLYLNESDYFTEAFLELRIVNYENQPNTPIPENLIFYVVDHLNRITAEYTTSIELIENREYNEAYYRILVTSFIKNQLAFSQNNEALLIALPTNNYYSSVDRLYLGSREHNNKSLLKLYFLNYEIDRNDD